MKQVKALAKRPRNYRKLLIAKKSELSSNLRTKLATLAGPGSTGSEEDLAALFSEQFTALRINRLDYVQLKLIEAALVRIDSEKYGLCLDCGNPIAGGRLEAIPWAIRCIACQELLGSDNDSSFANDWARLEEVST